MTHLIVQLTIDEDGNSYPYGETWHLVTPYADGNQIFCSGEYFGLGEGNARGKLKKVLKGGITCQNCLSKIKDIRAVKL
jgi:hypothetical protein